MKAPKEAIINTLGGTTLGMNDNSSAVALAINKGEETILDLGVNSGIRTYIPFHAVEQAQFHMVDVTAPNSDDTCFTEGSDLIYELEDRDGTLYYDNKSGGEAGATLLPLLKSDLDASKDPKLKVGDDIYNYDRTYTDMGGIHLVFSSGTRAIDVRNADVTYMS